MEQVEELEVARFYTRSRRFPKMVGRLPDGTRIWGGPYTPVQFLAGGVVLLGALITRSWWGFDGSLLFDLPVAVGMAWGAAYLTGRIPVTKRNLLSIIGGAITAVRAPRAGRYRAAPIRLRPPHQVTGRVQIDELTTSGVGVPADRAAPVSTEPAPAVVAAPEARSDSVGTSARPVSGVERLLQQTRAK